MGLLIRPACFLPWGDGFEQPTPTEVREFIKSRDLTGSDVARICGVNPRTVRRWMAGEDTRNVQPIPYAAWKLLVITTQQPAQQSI